MKFKVYVKHINWKKSKPIIVESNSHTGAAKKVLTNLKSFGFYPVSTLDMLNYEVTRVINLK